MKRIPAQPRKNWQEKVEKLGFNFHTNPNGEAYWKEDAYYSLTCSDMEKLTNAVEELHSMCLRVTPFILSSPEFMNKMGLSTFAQQCCKKSWETDRYKHVYGRFDLLFHSDGEVKLLEYNADTPTCILESGSIQNSWILDSANGLGFTTANVQNRLEAMLSYRWKSMVSRFDEQTVYFSCLKENVEDLANTRYMMKLAEVSGITCSFIYVEDIGFSEDEKVFIDLNNNPIKHMWKLYPWEWLIDEDFAPFVDKLDIVEPAWKMLLSNKCILPILWATFPGHPNLLPATFLQLDMEKSGVTHYIKKPILGREGANCEVFVEGDSIFRSLDGAYDKDGFVYQQLCDYEKYDGYSPVIGGWVVGDKSAGFSIREDKSIVTTNVSHTVPMVIG